MPKWRWDLIRIFFDDDILEKDGKNLKEFLKFRCGLNHIMPLAQFHYPIGK
jgi:hypothetical protein